MFTPSRTRPGFALPVALMAIVVIGALIAGAFFSSTQESRVGRNSLAEQRAFAAAENGLGTVADTITPMWITNGLAVGTPRTFEIVLNDSAAGTNNTAIDSVRVTRLAGNLVLITSMGVLNSGAARRQTSMVLRAAIPNFNMPGALTVNGGLTISGSSQISGFDNQPPGWDEEACPEPTAGLAGIATQPGVTIRINGAGCDDLSCVSGPQQQLETSAAGDTSTYFVYGNTNWNELVAMATVRIAAGTYSGVAPSTTLVGTTMVCNTADQRNWGEPWHDGRIGAVPECYSRYPIIYADGNLRFSGAGRGQGILLVNGDLSLSGGFQFYGPIILRGDLKTTGSNFIYGSVSAANVDLDKETSVAAGNPTINYSNCSIQTAISNSVQPTPLRNRSWVELY
jgi:hypothetical protein